jgi:hypothetical protein
LVANDKRTRGEFAPYLRIMDALGLAAILEGYGAAL